ncbi:hypothetical protein [Candidatus Enterovibrio escicola]|uniref:hypothetical protein n=1 Tax=Candidatus Enterovibrio escicola TaxID=1927127 RepID=UPI001237A243
MDDNLCLLVVIGVDDTCRKEMLAVVDGYRESEVSWFRVLSQLTSQDISIAPERAIGDGAFCFWNAVTKHCPTPASSVLLGTQNGQCIKQSSKICSTKNEKTLHDIWIMETQQEAQKAFGQFKTR